jgi:hypothetical protein
MVTMAVAGLNDVWPTCVIAHRLSDGTDDIRQGGITNILIGPHCLDQVMFGDDLTTVFEKVEQNLEDFGSEAKGKALTM